MVNKPLIRPAISGGGTLGGGRLTSHDIMTPGWLELNFCFFRNQGLADALTERGIVTPSPIQHLAMPKLAKGLLKNHGIYNRRREGFGEVSWPRPSDGWHVEPTTVSPVAEKKFQDRCANEPWETPLFVISHAFKSRRQRLKRMLT